MNSFSHDLDFLLSKDDKLLVLSNETGKAQIIVSPKYQGKVFTSTVNGLDGLSFGYIDYKAFDAEEPDGHINVYGGENRFWLGPEGGKFSIFFLPGSQQIFENWHTPSSVDIESWDIVSSSKNEVVMAKSTDLKNNLDFVLGIHLNRRVKLLLESEINSLLDISIPSDVQVVAYKTENSITNKNNFEWNKKTGTICVWMLDMLIPSSNALTIIPFDGIDEESLGKIATTDYFGEIPQERIKQDKTNIYLKTDGNYRCKLGLNPHRSKSIAGNYDPDCQRLTIVTLNTDKQAMYLNQEWGVDKRTFDGDALNAYNDGPLEDGSILGPFLELESSSPAAFLKPNETLTHYHSVFHFIGDDQSLSEISTKLLGVSVQQLKNIF